MACALLALLACGVGGYALFGFSLPDAVYMTVMTPTTEGLTTGRLPAVRQVAVTAPAPHRP
ncbi:hypothetical protein [Streptomyces sp. DSM 118148]|uniref:hypothetical protein n=1 Tax=Streptomyces sp. DSM 118148 TaxID=3448667 RepID=UPI0040403081